MKAEYVNPVFKAVTEVFQLMLDLSVSRVREKDAPVVSKKVDIRVDLKGDISGSIYFRFPQDTTLKMVQIMSGMEIKQLDEFAISAMSEMSNIISGNAANYLSQQNFHCDITPPEILVSSPEDKLNFSNETLGIPLHTKAGDLSVYLSLSENLSN